MQRNLLKNANCVLGFKRFQMPLFSVDLEAEIGQHELV
jgi:hypothetical protein